MTDSSIGLGVKIKAIEERHQSLGMTPAEFKALQKLIETKTGRRALEKLLINCGESNLHSTLTYIDGCTGIKPLELVNAHTRLPIAEETLHEHFSSARTSSLIGDPRGAEMEHYGKYGNAVESSGRRF